MHADSLWLISLLTLTDSQSPCNRCWSFEI